MKIKFCGGARMVTGSNHLIETKNSKILLDCGMFQGGRQADKLNSQDFLYNPQEIEAVLVSHAHIDHIGRLPLLVKKGFKGKIYSTLPTKDLASIMLKDSEGINKSASLNKGIKPLYDMNDVFKTMELFEGVDYDKKIDLNSEISFTFYDAGHILGSAMIEIIAEDKKIVFSGDLGNSPTPLLKAATMIGDADYMLVESTYGKFVHEDQSQRRDLLEDAIESTVSQKGTLLIPSFSLERAQELLFELNYLIENNKVPRIPIFIDSPLAINLTDVYKKNQEYFNKNAVHLIESGDDLFNFPGLKLTKTSQESKLINEVKPPKIIIAGSGMSTGGRILHHEIRYLSDSRNTFLVVCYQAQGTLGRKIFEKAKVVQIFGQKVPIRCQIKSVGGYSAHADQPALIEWVNSSKDSLKKVFIVHGEEIQANALSLQIKDHLGLSAEVPKMGATVTL